MSAWMIRSQVSCGGPVDWLTRQHREDAVRWHVARGHSDRQIAQDLGVCDRTVMRIRRRLRLPNVYGKTKTEAR